MICSSEGTIVLATGYSFPISPVKRSSRFYVSEIRNHLPINVTARRRSSMAVDAMTVRSKLSPMVLLSGASDRVSAVFYIREIRQKKRKICDSPRKRNIGCGVSPLPTPTTAVDEHVAVRRGLAVRRVLEDNGGDGSSVRDFSLFTTKRGDTLFTQSWTRAGSVKNRGLVVLLHGLNEHSGRYSDFAKQLNFNGFKVYGIDWIGHGGSDGLHAYVPSLDYAVTDLNSFLEKVIAENPGLPCFCIGHSTGGAIILKAMLDPKIEARVSGIVLTSPAVGVQPSHPIFGVLAPFLAFLMPRYQLSAAKKKVMPVSRDPEALMAKYSDPLVYTGSIRVRTGYEILRLASHLLENLNRIKVPFLVLHGTSDTVTDPKATQRLYDEASSSDKSIKLLDGLLHDLLFEPVQAFYKESKSKFDSDPVFKEKAQQAVVRLQGGDPIYRKAWAKICEISRTEFAMVYKRLRVELEEKGESFYNPYIPSVIEELNSKGLVEESEGARVIFLEGFNIPLMVVKSDGGFNYASTDLTALWYRLNEEKAEWIIYVTDVGQQQHFNMFFKAARKAGWLPESDKTYPRVDHVGFGLVVGEDKKRFRTRSTDVVRLVDLLDEAKTRSKTALIERGKDKEWTPEKLDQTAEAVGYGAVKYADLKNNRTTNYQFSFDEMLNDKGDTAVYLLYAHARISSIITKSGKDIDELKKTGKLALDHEGERALALHLLRFAETVEEACTTLLPSVLCAYLYELSNRYTTFYSNCQVIGSPEETSRLLLCEATAIVMRKCFHLLGITPVYKI